MDSLFKTDVLSVLRIVHRNSLTVLNYHRINNRSNPGFDTFKPNVSALPALFDLQMKYVKQNYNVITCRHLAAWLRQEADLPQYPALITFDDGYLDNLVHAYPILKKYGLSAIIFLTTDYINRDIPFYWDYVAYCFYHTKQDVLPLSQGSELHWHDIVSLDKAVLHWINVVKRLPDVEKQARVGALASLLNVNVPTDAFKGLCLTWDQVREMHGNGIEFGAHTVHHPILTCIPLANVAGELAESKHKIESEIGEPVVSFAYPNGQKDDFSPEVVDLVRKTGYELAFTLLPGPTHIRTVRRNPLTVRRVYLGYKDKLPRFAAKLIGGGPWAALF